MNTEQKITECLTGLTDIQRFLVGAHKRESIAERMLKSAGYHHYKNGSGEGFKFALRPGEVKTAITSTLTVNDPLIESYTPTIDAGTRRAITIRNLLPEFPTLNGAIELPRKTAATLGSPAVQVTDNSAFGESAFTFSTSYEAVKSIGHHVPVSRQLFEDAGSLDAFIQQELLHGLAQIIDDQLLNGDSSASALSGLITGATAYTVQSPNLTNEADILRDAIKQIENSDFQPNAIILNPSDWYDIDVKKAGASDDTYNAGEPRLVGGNTLWGLQVVSTPTIASGTFLVGDFNRAGILFNRQQAEIEVSRYHDQNFEKNMLQIMASERLALVITNADAMRTGSL